MSLALECSALLLYSSVVIPRHIQTGRGGGGGLRVSQQVIGDWLGNNMLHDNLQQSTNSKTICGVTVKVSCRLFTLNNVSTVYRLSYAV